jgi:hypothetical protein
MKRLDSTGPFCESGHLCLHISQERVLTLMKSSPPVSTGRNSVKISASYGIFHQIRRATNQSEMELEGESRARPSVISCLVSVRKQQKVV